MTPQPPTGWKMIGTMLHRSFATGTFVRGVDFVTAIRDLAEAAQHHPDIILTYTTVSVTMTTHDVGTVTAKDIALAQQINDAWQKLA